ncbi:hypothetical protein CSH63_24840 [Micromonospora tulbaghiae]|uniref:Uncharacterized protein n=1 Tax=Micromonospora tulbaghiae TaxID=479978 RepID=A0A386WRR5_9ACTN|nr:hypothetical protein [Micromonospora tulbaghiae]AYF30612.1 hypothetical protein CSH63_24840 [Micromonospora tulbaghiae]
MPAAKTTNKSEQGSDKPTAQEVADKVAAEGHTPGERPNVTIVEGQQPGDPSAVAPGDAPADTTDPRERVSTVPVDAAKAAEAAKAGQGPVAAYVKTGDTPVTGPADPNRDVKKDRYEEYEHQGVKLRRNMETGKSERVNPKGESKPE